MNLTIIQFGCININRQFDLQLFNVKFFSGKVPFLLFTRYTAKHKESLLLKKIRAYGCGENLLNAVETHKGD